MKRFEIQIIKLETSIRECNRYVDRAQEAIQRLKDEQELPYGAISTKEMGAVRRAAVDVGREMTKINQLKMY